MVPFLVTLGLALHQMVEHLDRDGRTGNPYGVMAAMLGLGQGHNLLHNHPLPGFLVPPEEGEAFNAVLGRLAEQPVHGKPLRHYLPFF